MRVHDKDAERLEGIAAGLLDAHLEDEDLLEREDELEDPDSPDEYRNLSRHERRLLQAWISGYISPRKTPNSRTSYGIKHAFEQSEHGFYLSNGQFKGAMLAAGYPPVDEQDLNWRFRISTRRVERV